MQALAAGGDHAGLPQDGEVLGDIGLAGAAGFHKLGDVLLTFHELIQQF